MTVVYREELSNVELRLFYSVKNLLEIIPHKSELDKDILRIKIRKFVYEDILEFKLTKVTGLGFVEYKFEGKDGRGSFFVTLSKIKKDTINVYFTYTGKNEKQMLKLFEEVISKLKEVKISHNNELP
ncbi:hypothetical protein [Stygiolobus azoricus]|uniref:DUF3211 domain-containing protein n=1 Tax=Stygiolobus azoricus TaxID=41675 RepID=A0A650CQ84_9CREN|nr:hypothetical protein [Stygiolobus azoricus]QGR19637.1 hypothetical protein D1868_06260 [Stygiolobus azoricus]